LGAFLMLGIGFVGFVKSPYVSVRGNHLFQE
jgi:hypothetical protein